MRRTLYLACNNLEFTYLFPVGGVLKIFEDCSIENKETLEQLRDNYLISHENDSDYSIIGLVNYLYGVYKIMN